MGHQPPYGALTEGKTVRNHANEEIKGLKELSPKELKALSAEEYEDYCSHLDSLYQP